MFHINEKDEAKVCRAKTPEKCRFYKGEDDTRHYESVAEAQVFIEKKLEAEHGGATNSAKKVKYSFVKAFKKQEEKFNADFEGIPNRFFNSDLRGKYIERDADEYAMNMRHTDSNRLGVRLITAVSSPSDNKISSEDAVKLLEEQGFENIQEITDEKVVRNFGSNPTRAWKATLEDKIVAISDGNTGTSVSRYSFKYSNEYFERGKTWTSLDLRKIAGNARAERKTGINVLKNIMKTESVMSEKKKFDERTQSVIKGLEETPDLPQDVRTQILLTAQRADYTRSQTVSALLALEDAQLEGKNFIAQKKYIKEHSGSVATVWEDKKDTDDIRKDLAKNSTVKDLFRKIDLDNDVDPKEYQEFENDINSIRDKMPAIPKGLEPELRLRKLGKHSSSNFTVSGLFNPAKNSLGISVNDSSSYVHEMMHYYDMTVKNNASLNSEFREISKDYMKNLKLPAGIGSKAEYYAVATEQLARCGEIWASERLGIDNRLINKEKFKNFDYAPIVENPELKEKVFKFFDKMFENDMK